MSAIANIVVPDAAATPVSHTFVPQKVEGNTARWTEKSATVPAGYWTLAGSLRDQVNGGKTYRHTLEFNVPKLKTYTDPGGNNLTVLDYVHRCKIELILPDLGTLQDRKDFRKLIVGILGDAQFVDMIENLNHSY